MISLPYQLVDRSLKYLYDKAGQIKTICLTQNANIFAKYPTIDVNNWFSAQ